jgi:hypothetical protein
MTNKQYSRAEVISFLQTSYSMSITPYYPLCDSRVSDFKVDDTWQKSITVAGCQFQTRSYSAWRGLHKRVKNGKNGKQPAYAKTTICPEWGSYDTFASWCATQPWFYLKDYALDSDLLSKGDKRYSPDTCTFLPREINSFIGNCGNTKSALPTGVFKAGKKFQARADSKHLGMFDTIESATAAYRHAKHIRAIELSIKYSGLIAPQANAALIVLFAPKNEQPLPHIDSDTGCTTLQ